MMREGVNMKVDVYNVGKAHGPLWKRLISLFHKRHATLIKQDPLPGFMMGNPILISRAVIRPWQAEMTGIPCSCNAVRGWSEDDARVNMINHHFDRVNTGECPDLRDRGTFVQRFPRLTWWAKEPK